MVVVEMDPSASLIASPKLKMRLYCSVSVSVLVMKCFCLVMCYVGLKAATIIRFYRRVKTPLIGLIEIQ